MLVSIFTLKRLLYFKIRSNLIIAIIYLNIRGKLSVYNREGGEIELLITLISQSPIPFNNMKGGGVGLYQQG